LRNARIPFTIVAVIAAIITGASAFTLIFSNRLAEAQASCDQSLWGNVWLPQRLHLVNSCVSVSGVIKVISINTDGDDHILLQPDPKFRNFTNSANSFLLRGYLVVEAVCQHTPISPDDAISACARFSGTHFVVPPIGTHVKVIGSYVLDKEHQNWAEIHPLSNMG